MCFLLFSFSPSIFAFVVTSSAATGGGGGGDDNSVGGAQPFFPHMFSIFSSLISSIFTYQKRKKGKM
jgi:hypothetical protein